MSTDMKSFIEIMTAFMTPLIASIAVFIAWQQWKTNALKVKTDVYDRRFRVYDETVKLLNIIARDANISIEDISKFSAATSEAVFLFKEDIPSYIEMIRTRSISLYSANRQYNSHVQGNGQAVGYDHEGVTNKIHEENVWLTDQLIKKVVVQKFKTYLDIS
ncbi:MAG: hypothetical protein WAZ48_02810 [Lysobacteraceae bacterium]